MFHICLKKYLLDNLTVIGFHLNLNRFPFYMYSFLQKRYTSIKIGGENDHRWIINAITAVIFKDFITNVKQQNSSLNLLTGFREPRRKGGILKKANRAVNFRKRKFQRFLYKNFGFKDFYIKILFGFRGILKC